MTDDALYNEFDSLLSSTKEEAPLQSFLEKHDELIKITFLKGSHSPLVFPQFHLADDFKPDFAMISCRSGGSWDVELIEIEPAKLDSPLFNKQREATNRLRTAEKQITDWQGWMSRRANQSFFNQRVLDRVKNDNLWENNPFFRTQDPNIDFIVYYDIVIGRRTDFVDWGDKYRTIKHRESGNKVDIVTWDRLLDNVKSLESRVVGKVNHLPIKFTPEKNTTE